MNPGKGDSAARSPYLWVLLSTLLGGFLFFGKPNPDAASRPRPDAHRKVAAASPSLGGKAADDEMLRPLQEFLTPLAKIAPVASPVEDSLKTQRARLQSSGDAPKPDPSAARSSESGEGGQGSPTSANQSHGMLADELKQPLGEQVHSLEFLICTIADPVESKMSYQFDAQLDAIEKALAAERFVLDRYYLPSAANGKDASKTDPGGLERPAGVLLFRRDAEIDSLPASKQPNAVGKLDLLQVYVVGETLASGLNVATFRRAVRHIVGLTRDFESSAKQVKANSRWIKVAGPGFSGAADSLARGVGACLKDSEIEGFNFEIINGSALAVDPQHFLQRAGNDPASPRVRIHATVHNGRLLRYALIEHIRKRNPYKMLKIAWLTETGTTYGTQLSRAEPRSALDGLPKTPREAVGRGTGPRRPSPSGSQDVAVVEFGFPANIARVRAIREQRRQEDSASKNALLTDRYRLPIPVDENSDADDFPKMVTPEMTGASVDVVLDQILTTIRNEGIEFVGITATDIRDPVFLAEMIRDQSPDVQILLVTGDLLYLHPDYRSTLHGALVASSYCLFPEDQFWCFPFNRSSIKLFQNQYLFGAYNAIILLRGLEKGNYCLESAQCGRGAAMPDALIRFRPPPDCNPWDSAHANQGRGLPIAYGAPMKAVTRHDASNVFEPSVWISIMGPTGIWPIDCPTVDALRDLESQGNSDDTSHPTSQLQPPDYLLAIQCDHSNAPAEAKPSYDARIAPSTWIVLWFWTALCWIVCLAARGRTVGNWTKALWFEKSADAAPASQGPGDAPSAGRCCRKLLPLQHVSRAVVLSALAAPTVCFSAVLAIPFLVRGADWSNFLQWVFHQSRVDNGLVPVVNWSNLPQEFFHGLSLVGAALAGVLLVALLVHDAAWLLAHGVTLAPLKRLFALILSPMIALPLASSVFVYRFLAPDDASAVLAFNVMSDIWNAVSVLLPVVLIAGVVGILFYSMLDQCQLLCGQNETVCLPARDLLLTPPDAERVSEARERLLYPNIRRAWQRQNIMYLAPPLLVTLWFVWLAYETANTQLPLWIDPTCVAFGFGSMLWCFWFAKAFEICRQLAKDLEDFTRAFDDPLRDWKTIVDRLGAVEPGGLRLLWGRHAPARLRKIDALRTSASDPSLDPFAKRVIAESLFALEIQRYARQVFRHGYRLSVALAVSGFLLLLTAESFPFNTEPMLRLTSSVMLVSLAIVMCWYYVLFDRQPLLSLLVGTTPDQIDWSWDMARHIAPPLLLGALALLAQIFPEMRDWIGLLVEPLSRSTG